jgi:hypothetical protein
VGCRGFPEGRRIVDRALGAKTKPMSKPTLSCLGGFLTWIQTSVDSKLFTPVPEFRYAQAITQGLAATLDA